MVLLSDDESEELEVTVDETVVVENDETDSDCETAADTVCETAADSVCETATDSVCETATVSVCDTCATVSVCDTATDWTCAIDLSTISSGLASDGLLISTDFFSSEISSSGFLSEMGIFEALPLDVDLVDLLTATFSVFAFRPLEVDLDLEREPFLVFDCDLWIKKS